MLGPMAASCPDLLLGVVDMHVLLVCRVPQLPHRGIHPIFLEGHRVPRELDRAQFRLQVLQLPGGDR